MLDKSEERLTGYSHLIEPIVGKLQILLKNRFGCELSFVTKANLNGKNIHTNLSQSNEIQFPVRVNGELYGVAYVQKPDTEMPLDSTQQQEIKEVMKLILVPSVRAAERIDVLQTLERHMINSEFKNLSNVVSIEERLEERRIKKVNSQKGADKIVLPKPKTIRLSFPCLIESPNELDIFKMAVELHEYSGRFAFVHYSHLDKKTRYTGEGLETLGPVTLFVPEIEQLKDAEIFSLSNYLEEQEHSGISADLPHIISGTTQKLSELTASKKIPESFVRKLSSARLQMKQSFTDYKRSGLLRFLMSQLETSTTDSFTQ